MTDQEIANAYYAQHPLWLGLLTVYVSNIRLSTVNNEPTLEYVEVRPWLASTRVLGEPIELKGNDRYKLMRKEVVK